MVATIQSHKASERVPAVEEGGSYDAVVTVAAAKPWRGSYGGGGGGCMVRSRRTHSRMLICNRRRWSEATVVDATVAVVDLTGNAAVR